MSWTPELIGGPYDGVPLVFAEPPPEGTESMDLGDTEPHRYRRQRRPDGRESWVWDDAFWSTPPSVVWPPS